MSMDTEKDTRMRPFYLSFIRFVSARLTAVLHTVPGHALLQLCRQGMLALAAKSKRGQSSLAALLQSCASAFGLQSLGCVVVSEKSGKLEEINETHRNSVKYVSNYKKAQ